MGPRLAALALVVTVLLSLFTAGCKGDGGKLEDAKSPDANYKAPGADPSAKPRKPMGTGVNPLDVK